MNEKSTIVDLLNRDGYLVYKVRGVSMEPMLKQNRDLVTIMKKDPAKRCRENDVVLYYRKSDRALTLHRIIEVREKDYVILGDNCINKEYGIPEDDILGILTSYTHDGREIKVTDGAYLLYVKKLRQNQALRLRYRTLRHWAATAVRKIIPKNS